MKTEELLTKPLLRGHFHQAAFFTSLGASAMLLYQAPELRSRLAVLVYVLSLNLLFGISALYHRPQWQPKVRLWLRRFDHAAIFVLIAGTGTPIFLIAVQGPQGDTLLKASWTGAALGVFQSLFWAKAPKWVSALLGIGVGWIVIPHLSALSTSLGQAGLWLLIVGGAIYTAGALVYALKWPNPFPRTFGYHEIFHLLVIVAAILHFLVIVQLL